VAAPPTETSATAAETAAATAASAVTATAAATREESLRRSVVATVIAACVSSLHLHLRLRLRQHHHLRLRLLHLLLHELLLEQLLLHLRAVIRHRGRGSSHVGSTASATIHAAIGLRTHTSTATTATGHGPASTTRLLATVGADELVEVTPRQDVVSRRRALEAFGHAVAGVRQRELLLVVLDARIVVHRRRGWYECEGIGRHVLSLFLSNNDERRIMTRKTISYFDKGDGALAPSCRAGSTLVTPYVRPVTDGDGGSRGDDASPLTPSEPSSVLRDGAW
jgi:hypothetical protein